MATNFCRCLANGCRPGLTRIEPSGASLNASGALRQKNQKKTVKKNIKTIIDILHTSVQDVKSLSMSFFVSDTFRKL